MHDVLVWFSDSRQVASALPVLFAVHWPSDLDFGLKFDRTAISDLF